MVLLGHRTPQVTDPTYGTTAGTLLQCTLAQQILHGWYRQGARLLDLRVLWEPIVDPTIYIQKDQAVYLEVTLP